MTWLKAALAATVSLFFVTAALAQPPGPPGRGGRAPQAPRPVPVEVLADKRVTFRIVAPEAKSVAIGGEFAGGGPGAPLLALTKDAAGVWSGTTAPIVPGAYRYSVRIDGASVVDPNNTYTSASRDRVQNVVFIPGSTEIPEENRIGAPHGAVAEVYYPSKFGGGQRRMHVYTPPGYETGRGSYPVLYLIHGGGDSDDSWPTVGRAGFILDNLIADGKAKPMIVVMADGNAGPQGQVMTGDPALEPFVPDLMQSIIPYVERSYRVSRRPQDRALAGLSMGGIQTMNAGFSNLAAFSSLGVFSSGFFPDDEKIFDAKMAPAMKSAASKLKVFYVAYGQTDIAKVQAESNLKMFGKYGLKPVVQVTEGGHDWINWRRYLTAFAPMLFR